MNLRKFSNSKEENKFVFLNGKKNIKLKLKEKYWLKKPFVKKRIAVRVVRKGKVVFSALRSHFGTISVDFLKNRVLKSAFNRKILSERKEIHSADLNNKEFFSRSRISRQSVKSRKFKFNRKKIRRKEI